MMRVAFFLDIKWRCLSLTLIIIAFLSCSEELSNDYHISLNDDDLKIDLIAQDPDIATPLGMAFDEQDQLYILESHTHTRSKDYQGPEFDRIKKWVDEDGDGIPESWIVFADSIEDGMNLSYHPKHGIFLSTKNSIVLYSVDDEGSKKHVLVEMPKPTNVYDHAGILGVTHDDGEWLYFSRGNSGGLHWVMQGSDGTTIEGFGDGGNVMRCKMNGSELEEIATGFWNPFDIKFAAGGRLFVTDNDPDSRGPNRLIEIVPGGDYGYKSVYGGSGIHPFLSWNGELPGTLPFAAPLGEAPCALTDATLTNFGSESRSEVLVCVWEESNIVRIDLTEEGSSMAGKPEVLVQGDHLFHPVAMISNSKGDLYVSDWVLRQYPNHGKGKIWRIRSNVTSKKSQPKSKVNRFASDTRSTDQLVAALKNGDVFEQAIARRTLAANTSREELLPNLGDRDAQVRLQVLLTFFQIDEMLNPSHLEVLLQDEDSDVQRMALIYIGEKGQTALEPILKKALYDGRISPDLFETFLAAIRHLQPTFIEGLNAKKGFSKRIPRELPEGFIRRVLVDQRTSETVKGMAIPYLEDYEGNKELILDLLAKAKDEAYQITLIKANAKSGNSDQGEILLNLALDVKNGTMARATALQYLGYNPQKYYEQVLPLLTEKEEVLQYAVIKYIGKSDGEDLVRSKIDQWIEESAEGVPQHLIEIWKDSGNGESETLNDNEWVKMVDNMGRPEIGRLVFEDRATLCVSCHRVSGWGGAFGPELSKVGSSKSQAQLINAILDPSSEISPEWQGWFVVDKNGDRHIGRQIDVNEGFAELMNVQGDFVKYSDPQSYGTTESSVMPEGLEKMMSPPEFNHLVSYLISLK